MNLDLRLSAPGWSGRLVSSAVGRGALVVAAAAVTGCVLAVLGVRFGPIAVVALPVVAVLIGWALNRPLVAAAAIPLSLPVGSVVLPGGFQVMHVATLAAIGFVVAHRVSARRGALPAPVGTAWLLALMALIALAVIDAPDRATAVNQTVTATIGGLGILAVVGACQGIADVRRMVGLTLAGGLVLCVMALPQASSISGSGVNVAGVTGIFSEHNQFGAFSAAILLLATGLLFGARTRWGRWGAALTGTAALASVGLALSRGAYLGTALGVLVLVAVLPRARRKLVTAGMLLLVVLGAAFVVVPNNPQVRIVAERLASFQNPAANPEDDRPAIWAEALRQIRLDPLTGTGPANFQVAAARSDSPVTFFVPVHAHDAVLTVAAEIGLPAAAILVVLTLIWTRVFLRAVRALPDERDKALAAGVVGAAATFVGEGVFDAAMRSAVILLLMCLCVGLALAVADAGVQTSPRRAMRWPRSRENARSEPRSAVPLPTPVADRRG